MKSTKIIPDQSISSITDADAYCSYQHGHRYLHQCIGINLAILAQGSSSNVLSAMDENQETRLLKKKIDELTKALADAQLKNVD